MSLTRYNHAGDNECRSTHAEEMRDLRNIPHAEEVGRAPLAKEQMNTSRVSDEEGPYAQARK